MHGIDLVLPDMEYVRQNANRVQAIVLTHGHEDHIGAVPYLLREKPDIPLVGSRLTLALVEAKLHEHRIKPYTLEVAEGHRERLTRHELEEQARLNQIDSLDKVRWAVLETSGQISFIPKQ